MAKALRTIPVILDIAKVIRETAPSALLANFTNPAGIVTEALTTHSKAKVIGLCNVPYHMVRQAEGLLPPNVHVWDLHSTRTK